MIVPQPPEDYPPPAKTPDIQYGGIKVNWTAIVVIVVLLAVIALLSWVAALVVGLLLALILVVNQTGTGNWIPGYRGDEGRAVNPRRSRRPRDY